MEFIAIAALSRARHVGRRPIGLVRFQRCNAARPDAVFKAMNSLVGSLGTGRLVVFLGGCTQDLIAIYLRPGEQTAFRGWEERFCAVPPRSIGSVKFLSSRWRMVWLPTVSRKREEAAVYFSNFRSRFASVRSRSALSLMKPAASRWS